jgi:hydrogenase-4 transcriptional activator
MVYSDFIDNYLGSVSRLGNAVSASVCIVDTDADMISHQQKGALLPELMSIEAARQSILDLRGQEAPVGIDGRDCVIAPGSHPDSLLILVPAEFARHAVNPIVGERRSYISQDWESADTWLLLGLRFSESADLPNFDMRGVLKPRNLTDWLLNFLIFTGLQLITNWQMSRVLRHPVSDLPGRVALERGLAALIKQFAQRKQPLSLICINPDCFEQINHRFGRAEGDKSIREIATLLRALLRESDLLFHYTGAIFAIVLPATDTLGTRAIVEKIRRALNATHFINGALRLTFSIGCACSDSAVRGDVSSQEIIRRADSALNTAKLNGGARTVFWNDDLRGEPAGSVDKGNAIFTADAIKDYRNMSLLWELMSAVTAEREVTAIGRELTSRVAQSFRSSMVALFGLEQSVSHQQVWQATDFHLLSASEWQAKTDIVSAGSVSAHNPSFIRLAGQVGVSRRTAFVSEDQQVSCCLIPLEVREQLMGVLFIDTGEKHQLDAKDLEFLAALVSQIAVSIDRADLLGKWLAKKEYESKQLRVEVRELRQAVRQSKLVYQSAEMQLVMDTVQKFARTDATVLITGESGTGKEMLGHAVHELSPRADQPFVTVDCGAISPTLIEAELFGRIKGAYTGADSTTKGYIRQARGGTLFLDEIGELPIDVQTRLLRFVQEKTVSAVGSSTSDIVDVRIIAATNRELLEEVRAGRFRSDLFYRLQVVTLTPPPLREHASDILPLTYHFLEKFSLQYQKRGLHLSTEAKSFLESYRWPGNVRELQHTMLRATLMVENQEIQLSDLGLPAANQLEVKMGSGERPTEVHLVDLDSMTIEQLWASLNEALIFVVSVDGIHQSPLGRWLAEDFLLLACSQSRGQVRSAAGVLGLAESTYRRQLTKAQRSRRLEPGPNLSGWPRVEKVVQQIVAIREADEGNESDNLLKHGRGILLEIVSRKTQGQLSRGATLMDVSTPTYKTWLGM